MNYLGKSSVTNYSTYGLALFLLLVPFEYPLADLVEISPLRIVGLIAMGLAVIDLVKKRNIKVNYRFAYIIAWLLFSAITIAWVNDTNKFLVNYSLYFNNSMMFLIFSLINFSKKEIKVLKIAIVYGVFLLLIYMTFVPNAIVYSQYQHRMSLNAGTNGLDPNYLAALMLVPFGIVINDIFNNSRLSIIRKLLGIIYCISIVWYIVLTGSRSGLLALLLIIILNMNISWKSRICIGIPLIIFVVFCLPFLTNLLSNDLLERFTLSAMMGNEAESGTRLIIWNTALKSLSDIKLVFGHGVGSSQTIVGNAIGNGKDMGIHNHYLAMLVEVGVIGFALINIPIFKMTKTAWIKDKGLSIAFLGIMFVALFIDVLSAKFFWSALLLLSASCSYEKNIKV